MQNRIFLWVALLLFLSTHSFAQDKGCDIRSIVQADETMYYYVAMDTFYFTQTKQLMGGMVSDKQHYFLTLEPKPAPKKIEKLRNYKPLIVRLANDTIYKLDFFDARFVQDSIFVIMYMFNLKEDKAFLKYDVESVTLETPLGKEKYDFKLHKEAIIHHLECLGADKNKQ